MITNGSHLAGAVFVLVQLFLLQVENGYILFIHGPALAGSARTLRHVFDLLDLI